MAKNRFGPPSAGQPQVSPAAANAPQPPPPEAPPQPGVAPLRAPETPAQATVPDEAAGRQEDPRGSLSHLQRLQKFKRNATEEMYELKGQVAQLSQQLGQVLQTVRGGNNNQPQNTEVDQLEQYLSSDQVQQQPHLLGTATAQYVKAQMGNLREEISKTIREEIGNAVTQERSQSSWKQDLIRTFGADADDQHSELSLRATEIFKEYQRRYPSEPLTPAVVKLAYWEAQNSLGHEQQQQQQLPGTEPNSPAQPYTAPMPQGPEPGQMIEGGSMGTQDTSQAEQQAVQAGNWRAGIAGAVGRIYADRVGA